ncbi:MAG: aspartate dehydrogenase, partial [Candidatus Bathyarchaeia archaeon]
MSQANLGGKLKIGIVGCGTIGSEIALAVDQGKIESELHALWDKDRSKAEDLLKRLKNSLPKIVPPSLLVKEVDIVIESASQSAVGELLPLVIEEGIDILVMSVGGLLGNEELIRKAREKNCRIYIPSGALAGLDAVQSASVGGIRSVILTTIKPPTALVGAPYVEEKKLDLFSLDKPTLIYEGRASEAIKLFPANVNVAAALALAGIGPEKTIVRVVVDPNAQVNTHRIEVEGEFGRISAQTENYPAPSNPRTSYLAVLSAIALLRKISSPLRI